MPKETIQDLKSNLHAAFEDALEAMFALGEKSGREETFLKDDAYQQGIRDGMAMSADRGQTNEYAEAAKLENAEAAAAAAEPEKTAEPAFIAQDYRHLNGPGETTLCGEVSTGLEVLEESLPLKASSRVTCPRCRAAANVN